MAWPSTYQTELARFSHTVPTRPIYDTFPASGSFLAPFSAYRFLIGIAESV